MTLINQFQKIKHLKTPNFLEPLNLNNFAVYIKPSSSPAAGPSPGQESIFVLFLLHQHQPSPP